MRSRRCGSRSTPPPDSPSRPRGHSSRSRSSSSALGRRAVAARHARMPPCASFPGILGARSSSRGRGLALGRLGSAIAEARRAADAVPTRAVGRAPRRPARSRGSHADAEAASSATVAVIDRLLASERRPGRPRVGGLPRRPPHPAGARPSSSHGARARTGRRSTATTRWRGRSPAPVAATRRLRSRERCAPAGDEGSAPLLPPRLRRGLRRGSGRDARRGTAARSGSTRSSRSAGRPSRRGAPRRLGEAASEVPG